jgi:hypothetical protein
MELRAINSARNLLMFHWTLQFFKCPELLIIGEQVRMKRLVISFILILALTNQAYAMGWLGGKKGGGGGSSERASSSGTTNSATKTPNKSTTGGIVIGTDGQGSGAGITTNSTRSAYASGSELTIIFLLGCTFWGISGLWRKISE